jgi:hypothetical protein
MSMEQGGGGPTENSSYYELDSLDEISVMR